MNQARYRTLLDKERQQLQIDWFDYAALLADDRDYGAAAEALALAKGSVHPAAWVRPEWMLGRG